MTESRTEENLLAAPGRKAATRLQAIRDAVSQVTAEQAGLEPSGPGILKAWWGNWLLHGGNGGWRNW